MGMGMVMGRGSWLLGRGCIDFLFLFSICLWAGCLNIFLFLFLFFCWFGLVVCFFHSRFWWLTLLCFGFYALLFGIWHLAFGLVFVSQTNPPKTVSCCFVVVDLVFVSHAQPCFFFFIYGLDRKTGGRLSVLFQLYRV